MKTVKKSIPLKKVENRQESARDKILKVAIDLFYSQGYDKTTTRQIIQKAGILNGSLYNSFASKEDIFKTIIVDALKDALTESEKFFSQRETIQDQIMITAFPVALELYVASKSKRSAELLYQAHQSWTILDGFVNVMIEWVSSHTTLIVSHENRHEVYLGVLAIMGCIGNLVGEFANADNYDLDYRGSIRLGLEVFCSVFKIPAFAVDDMMANICNIIETNDIQIFSNLLDNSFSNILHDNDVS